jgi:hypothetical protein
MRKLIIGFLIILVFIVGCTAKQTPEMLQMKLDRFMGLSKEHFSFTATIKDDQLDIFTTITTVDGFKEERGLNWFSVTWDDTFLRAFINKNTGEKVFQVYQIISYNAENWKFYQSVNFETPSGIKHQPLTIINRDVDCTGSYYFGCIYTEHIGFNVDESLLRSLADIYDTKQKSVWKFKFKCKNGLDYKTCLLPAEAAGLLEKVDEYIFLHFPNMR